MKLINPDQGGSPTIYKNGLQGEITTSLSIGSGVHELVLQPDDFELGPDLNKPTAKLGMVVDCITGFRNQGETIYNSIVKACQKVHYYENKLDSKRITAIIAAGLEFYIKRKKYDENRVILLSSKERQTVETCVRNLTENYFIQRLLKPTDIFDDAIPSYNEDAFFVDFEGEYEGTKCLLRLKMKADNWTIDTENKILTLNDLKTTSHYVGYFMDGSFVNFHYSRQFALYLDILLAYAKVKYDLDETWDIRCNVIVVETTGENKCMTYRITSTMLEEGKKEYERLLKMVAYCEINGYDDTYEFI